MAVTQPKSSKSTECFILFSCKYSTSLLTSSLGLMELCIFFFTRVRCFQQNSAAVEYLDFYLKGSFFSLSLSLIFEIHLRK